ncbi:MAG: type II toxin-antitoxin system PemK/MazF family toxin [Moheibacter sp.]
MRQAEIWEMYFDPVKGSEQGEKKPAVIASGDLMNKYLKVVIVCPLTVKIKNYKRNLILEPDKLNGLDENLKC